jgi:hypothetical protein
MLLNISHAKNAILHHVKNVLQSGRFFYISGDHSLLDIRRVQGELPPQKRMSCTLNCGQKAKRCTAGKSMEMKL